jgi:hypothetical protein
VTAKAVKCGLIPFISWPEMLERSTVATDYRSVRPLGEG